MTYREYRHALNLSQQDVADATGRTVNFVLKAEDLTFPTPPPAITEFYLKYKDELGVDRDIINSAYFAHQRTLRHAFLEDYWPVVESYNTDPFIFRQAWINTTDGGEQHSLFPTQYRLSKGLCLPASVLYGMEVKPEGRTPAVVRTCMDQLILYVASGEYAQYVAYQTSTVDNVLSGLERIKELLP
jgi:transcriptional regulator with XRE-family HTH domain